MKSSNIKKQKRVRNHAKNRTKIKGTSECPRLAVFKSNKYIYAQIIDDDASVTLASASSKDAKGKTPLLKAKEVGALVAKNVKTKKIKAVVFDRGGFIFTGRVKALAEGAREAGLSF